MMELVCVLRLASCVAVVARMFIFFLGFFLFLVFFSFAHRFCDVLPIRVSLVSRAHLGCTLVYVAPCVCQPELWVWLGIFWRVLYQR